MSAAGTSAAPRTGGVVTFGETMGLFVSANLGPLAHADTARLSIGGAESNVAIALRRLGVSATWVGRRGDDSVGDLVERELRAEGLEVIAIRDPAQTGLMIKERRSKSASRVWYYRAQSAGSRLAPGDIPEGLIERSALLHVTGITPALSATVRDATFEAVFRAKTAGVPVSFDINFRSRLWSQDQACEALAALAAASDLVFAGDEEARIIVDGTGEVELARAIRELGPRQVVIKLGARGRSSRSRPFLRTSSTRSAPATRLWPGISLNSSRARTRDRDWPPPFVRGLSPARRRATGRACRSVRSCRCSARVSPSCAEARDDQ